MHHESWSLGSDAEETSSDKAVGKRMCPALACRMRRELLQLLENSNLEHKESVSVECEPSGSSQNDSFGPGATGLCVDQEEKGRPTEIKAGQLLGLSHSVLKRESLRDAQARFLQQCMQYKQACSMTDDDMSLGHVLSDSLLFPLLRSFAESQCCTESIFLWEQIEQFKRVSERQPAFVLARRIWTTFLSPYADMRVLVKPTHAMEIFDQLNAQSSHHDMFDDVQADAYSIILSSVYPLFIGRLASGA